MFNIQFNGCCSISLVVNLFNKFEVNDWAFISRYQNLENFGHIGKSRGPYNGS